jgi:3-oxoadipate enol-lactonase
MPKIPVRDMEVNYVEEGTGFPLVLIHGLNGDSTGWAKIIPEFAQHYRTIAPDVRGHGGTSKPDIPYSVKQFSEDLLEFFQKLNLSQAHILGLSMGGAIAQQFALDHPERIRSLILVSTFSYIDPYAQRVFLRLRKSLEGGGYPAFFDEVVKIVFTPEYVAANTKGIADLKQKRIQINSPIAIGRATDALLVFNLKEEISRIFLPTLILSGKEDEFTPIHLAEQIHHSIKGSEWKIVEGVGHNLYIEKPAEMAQIVLDFLARH